MVQLVQRRLKQEIYVGKLVTESSPHLDTMYTYNFSFLMYNKTLQDCSCAQYMYRSQWYGSAPHVIQSKNKTLFTKYLVSALYYITFRYLNSCYPFLVRTQSVVLYIFCIRPILAKFKRYTPSGLKNVQTFFINSFGPIFH